MEKIAKDESLKALVKAVNSNPMKVTIKLTQDCVVASCDGLEVAFPIVERMYTKVVCSLANAHVLATGSLQQEKVNEELIFSLARATALQNHFHNVIFK